MVVEILGAKMLSPYLGTSHFVWTAQIAVTMVALACGYYVGGRMADKSMDLARLYAGLIGAGIYLGLTVLVREKVAYWCLGFDLAMGSLLASAILFFVPLALLAMTGPFVIRILTSSVTGVGTNVGRLTSVSTLGSLGGTILIGYFLIPLMPNTVTMYATALLLFLIAGVYFAMFNRRYLIPATAAILVGATPGFGVPSTLKPKHRWVTELDRRNSHFGMLQVIQRQDGIRYYLNDYLIQDTYDPVRKQSVSHFTYMLSGLAKAYNTNIQEVLCIGLGIGIVPMEFAREKAKVDVVEINPAAVPVAVKFFDLEPALMNIVIDDGRHFLNTTQRKYDAVILDAFLGDSSPTHLFTREAFESVRRVLRPDGVLVINSFGSMREGKDFFAGSLYKTLLAVFASVQLYTNGDGGFFFAASPKPGATIVRRPRFEDMHPEVRLDAERSFAGTIDTIPENGLVLTDNYNPAEFYDAENREEFRRRMAIAIREM